MPKIVFIKLQVPSGSRPERLKPWLNNLLEEHRMEVQTVEEVDEPRDRSSSKDKRRSGNWS